MFWRDRERESKSQNCMPSCGQVRVLVVGDSGVGKTSLVHLIAKGSAIHRPSQTVGCTVEIKHITYNPCSSSSSIKGDSERDFFVELWDVSGHDRYKDCRSLFYSQINGVIFVHDLSQRRTKTSLQKWAGEIASSGTFSAPLSSGGPVGLPIPYLVIGNKADVAAKEGSRGSTGNLVDVARQWVEKQGLLPSSEELPLTESFPGSGALISAAREAKCDMEALMKFFCLVFFFLSYCHCFLFLLFQVSTSTTVAILFQLVRRRYFPEESPAPNLWPPPFSSSSSSSSLIVHSCQRLDDQWSDDEHFYRATTNFADEQHHGCSTRPPLPAQHNLTPPPTLHPQQPISLTDRFSLSRFPSIASQETSSLARLKRMDINV